MLVDESKILDKRPYSYTKEELSHMENRTVIETFRKTSVVLQVICFIFVNVSRVFEP